MNTINHETRKSYSPPSIERIKLDSEISLQLASNSEPDYEPNNWNTMNKQDHFTNDPFKMA